MKNRFNWVNAIIAALLFADVTLVIGAIVLLLYGMISAGVACVVAACAATFFVAGVVGGTY